jgi:hypothetical protein
VQRSILGQAILSRRAVLPFTKEEILQAVRGEEKGVKRVARLLAIMEPNGPDCGGRRDSPVARRETRVTSEGEI